MSGRSNLGNLYTQIPRRSTRGKAVQETALAPGCQAEVTVAVHHGNSYTELQQVGNEELVCDVDDRQLGHYSRRNELKWSKRASKRAPNPPCHIKDPLGFITKATATSDLDRWKGWCEVESEPAFFNVILRHLGVNGVKAQEVFSLDDEMLNFLPKPIYGLIFLFQFEEDDPSKQEATCPENIWFANQTTSNACASIALLNITMNIREVDLGPTLSALKDFSMPLTPALRGYAVGNHDYLRKVHNSFSRKMDMLNADLFLSNDVTSKNLNGKAPGTKGKDIDHEQAGFHFISLVPIDGKLWKLDGLERQPMNLGEYTGNDWMDLARSIIEKRMQQCEGDQIQFSLLALCQSPLLSVHNSLTENIFTISAVEEQLAISRPDWRSFIDRQYFDKTIVGPYASYGITQQDLNSASVSALDLWKQLSDLQAPMRALYIEEETAIQQDEERAATRYHDYTPMVNAWLAALADKKVLKDLVNAASHGHYHE